MRGELMIKKVILGNGFSEKEARNHIPKPLFDNPQIEETVKNIVENVRKRGDAALFEYTERFDKIKLDSTTVKVSAAEFDGAYSLVDDEYIAALNEAKKRITSFHLKQKQNSWFSVEEGVYLGQLIRPVERAGIYVPGGRAALAFGTESIKKVDVISGPGNIYVTLAKKMVVGSVDIDMLAGPSEVVIIADSKAKPNYVAADMLAQAEHDPLATAIMITDSEELASSVTEALEIQLARLDRREIAEKSIMDNGRILVVESIDEGLRLANIIAPEHLELMIENPLNTLGFIKHAGAIFLGPYTPEAVGDYVAGPNHVLPTGGTARFYSPLSVDTFLKKSSVLSFSKEALGLVGDTAIKIADSEGFTGHAKSVKYRMGTEI
ncbi:MAG: histidinol dehydrogenase [Rubrobacteridae bacterium]|nr:histidinol dehydrogenase [Rubrobacteridae bacterium]